jgi:hypothetical protein
MKKLLEEIKEYIEKTEVNMDCEWGECRDLEAMIADNSMPELYNKVCEYLKKHE